MGGWHEANWVRVMIMGGRQRLLRLPWRTQKPSQLAAAPEPHWERFRRGCFHERHRCRCSLLRVRQVPA
jgi:hypothetical protein